MKTLSLAFAALQNKDYSPEPFVQSFLMTHPDYLPLGTQHDSDEFMQEIISIFSRSNPQLSKAVKELF